MTNIKYYYETMWRTLCKTFTSRLAIILSQLVASLIVTDGLSLGEHVIIGTLTLNLVIYIGVERSWNLTNFGQYASEKTLFADTWHRTVFKTVTIRLAAFANNFLVPWLVTGSAETAILFMSITTLGNTFMYVVNERMWNRIQFGRKIKVLTIY